MDLIEGVIPVTELKIHTKEILKRVNRTGEPVLITQNGHSAVMIVDVSTYQRQSNKLRLLEAIAKGEREILEGKGISHEEISRKVADW